MNCNAPFLYQPINSGKFCSKLCSKTKKHHPQFGKKLSIFTKKKIKNTLLKRTGGYYTNNISFYDTYAHQISFCEEIRRNKEDRNILEIKCAYCGKWFIPTMTRIINRIQALNGEMSNGAENRLYCSTQCKQECPIFYQKLWPKGFKPASSREVQPELRQMCFKRDKFTCQKCGKTQDELETGLHCHHTEGIRWEPLESADLDKVITFCKTCHIEVHKQPDCGYHDMMCREVAVAK